jgi:hypothetical protein
MVGETTLLAVPTGGQGEIAERDESGARRFPGIELPFLRGARMTQ